MIFFQLLLQNPVDQKGAIAGYVLFCIVVDALQEEIADVLDR